MTVTTAAPSGIPFSALGAARLLAGTGAGHLDLAGHRRVHGMPGRHDATQLAGVLDAVRLLGRGGAAFPVATKLRGTAVGSRTHVLVNGSEGEPASHKDRALMRLAPHLVLDGALAVARALETRRVTVAVADPASYRSLHSAIRERTDAKRVRLVRHDHGFVGGEVRAVTRALSGGPAVPPGRRVLPTVHGIDDRPTFASNVETFAQIGLLTLLGVDDFASVGSADEPGTTLLTVIGSVPHAGVVEVPTGIPLTAIAGEGPGPLLVGGYHGTWVADPRGLTLSRPALRAAGVPLNAGVLARLPESTCALGEVAAVSGWLADQSVGQCGPCFFGLPALAESVRGLVAGRDLLPEAARRVGLLPGRGACAHPDGSAAFVRSALAAMPGEIETHRRHGGCGRAVLGALPLGSSTPDRRAVA
ncbi:MAG: NADH-ubiquinone oxidoreductase-F iron-sulfur binding region domain-containing protein [Nocardioides sp.]